jgi:hypothetical protein
VKQETLKVLEDSSAVLTISTGAATSATKTFGWLDYLDVHAAGIGVLLTIFFGIGYLTFHYLSLKKQSMAEKDKVRLDKLSTAFSDHQKETKKEFEKVGGGIQTILDKLDKQG